MKEKDYYTSPKTEILTFSLEVNLLTGTGGPGQGGGEDIKPGVDD